LSVKLQSSATRFKVARRRNGNPMSHFALPLLATLLFQAPPHQILSLGDSYTIGESVSDKERWPNQLRELLEFEGIRCAAPEIIAKTGWTTDELLAALQPRTAKDSYDIVTLLIGVNNQYRGRDVEAYRQELRKLIDFAIEKASGNSERVILLSIPDWGVTPFAKDRDQAKIAVEIDTYNRVKKEEAERAKVHFIDITDITRDVEGPKQNLLAEDGLHPSGLMYRQWAQKTLPIAKRILRQ